MEGVARTQGPTRLPEVVRRVRSIDHDWAVGLLAAGFALGLAIHAAHYWPFFSDDAFISLRYAQRFAHGEGLTWTAGERVEGYTDLLWVLLLGAVSKLGVDLMVAARV